MQKLEVDYGKKLERNQNPLILKSGKSEKEGGGVYAIIKDGLLFDSLCVNFSEVSGKFKKKISITNIRRQ